MMIIYFSFILIYFFYKKTGIVGELLIESIIPIQIFISSKMSDRHRLPAHTLLQMSLIHTACIIL